MKYYLVFLIPFFFGCSSIQKGSLQEFEGTWSGHYYYQGEPVDEVAFTATFTQEGMRIKGNIVEPNTFGSTDAANLQATVEGEVTDTGEIKFIKTYDGTGGVTHSVEYKGQRKKHAVNGGWTIDNGTAGRFQMQRD